MSDLYSESWEKEYLKKADEYEKACQKEDSLGYLCDLQAPSTTAEQAVRFLRKVSFYAKISIAILMVVILAGHYISDHSTPIAKNESGEFERLYPSKVE